MVMWSFYELIHAGNNEQKLTKHYGTKKIFFEFYEKIPLFTSVPKEQFTFHVTKLSTKEITYLIHNYKLKMLRLLSFTINHRRSDSRVFSLIVKEILETLYNYSCMDQGGIEK